MSIECQECKSLSRRSFLTRGGAALAALAYTDPLLNLVGQTYAQTVQGTGNLLVLCELTGGMDSLSFLAPFRNSTYRSNRPQLALAEDEVHPLADAPDYGINQQFGFFNDLYEQGQLAVVQQVGYPDANGSHFESQEIFRYGVRDLTTINDIPWYDRLRKLYFNETFGMLETRKVGDPQTYGYPDTTSRKGAQSAFEKLSARRTGGSAAEQAVRQAYNRINALSEQIRERTADFESTGDARGEFFRTAKIASAGLGTRIIKLTYGGFDTHGSQADANASLFPKLNDEFAQFVADAQALGIWNKTTVVFYTEFGRRNVENGSPGTDHGYGSHMILAGPGVNPGLHGQNVTSSDLAQKNLPYYVDFRAVFSSAIRDWLGFDPTPIFSVPGESFDANVGSALFR
jgi:uncharacterized protein (DUF1501 family)